MASLWSDPAMALLTVKDCPCRVEADLIRTSGHMDTTTTLPPLPPTPRRSVGQPWTCADAKPAAVFWPTLSPSSNGTGGGGSRCGGLAPDVVPPWAS